MGRWRNSLAIGVVLATWLVAPQPRAQNASDFFNLMGSIARQAQQAETEKRRDRELVVRLQRALGQLGFYSGTVDGVFGQGTQAAVARYFQSIGRSPYSQLTVADLEAMETAALANDNVASQERPEIEYDPITSPQGANRALSQSRASPPIKLELSDNAAWIVAASGEDREQVLQAGNLYAADFLSAVVVRSNNGRFAILLGWLPKPQARDVRDALKELNLIPADAFLSSGEKFDSRFWSVDSDRVSNRQALLQYGQFRPSPEFWSHAVDKGAGAFSALKYASQVGGGSGELIELVDKPASNGTTVRRLAKGTPIKISSEFGDWKKVSSMTGAEGWVRSKSLASLSANSADDMEGDDGDVPENAALESTPGEQHRNTGARIAAEDLLSDLGVFLKDHPDLPEIATLADEAARLRTAIDEGNSDQIEASVGAIRKALGNSTDFAAFSSRREKERGEAKVKELGQAVALARKNVFFLRRYIADNLTSESAPKLSPILKAYTVALTKPDIDILTDLNKNLESQVTASQLTSFYQSITAAYGATTVSDAGKTVEPQVTDRNRFLIEGANEDSIILFNASGNAPNVVRNLRGEIIFENQRAVGCSFHAISQVAAPYVDAAKALVRTKGAATVTITDKICSDGNIDQYDLIVGMRGELLKIEKDRYAVLLGLVEEGHFQLFDVMPGVSLAGSTTGNFDSPAAIESGVMSGERKGYGVVRVKNPSQMLCVVVATQAAGHQAIIDGNSETLTKAFDGSPKSLTTSDIDSAFIATKRNQCGGLYASSLDLKAAIEGFKRDKLGYQVLPIWVSDDALSKAVVDQDKKAKAAAEAAAEQKRKLADRKALDAKKAADEANSKSAREEIMRSENGARARAGQITLTNQVRTMVDDPASESGSAFPQTSQWLKGLKDDGWEFVGVSDEIADFGVSDWKNRKLETVVIDYKFAFKNRTIGENKVYCRRLGIIIDSEFDMFREPVEDECAEQSATIANWKLGQKFSSQWVAN